VRSDHFVVARGMAVAPEARGLRIGKALLNLTEGFAREHGVNRMFLYTTAFLLRAIRLYRSFPRDAGNELMEPGARQTATP
jgi:GNAT superfamily N-acetyltransferase